MNKLIYEYLQTATAAEKKHLEHLQHMLDMQIPLKEIFLYGAHFLPQTSNNNGLDLNALHTYTPDIQPFFDVLAQDTTLPQSIQDLATNLALYANGSSAEIDVDVYKMNPIKMIGESF